MNNKIRFYVVAHPFTGECVVNTEPDGTGTELGLQFDEIDRDAAELACDAANAALKVVGLFENFNKG